MKRKRLNMNSGLENFTCVKALLSKVYRSECSEKRKNLSNEWYNFKLKQKESNYLNSKQTERRLKSCRCKDELFLSFILIQNTCPMTRSLTSKKLSRSINLQGLSSRSRDNKETSPKKMFSVYNLSVLVPKLVSRCNQKPEAH